MKKSRFITLQLWLYHMTTIVFILLHVVMYIIRKGENGFSDMEEMLFRGIFFLMMLLIVGVNLFAATDIFYAVSLYKNGDLDRLVYGVRKIKLGTILYYIIIFEIGCLFFAFVQMDISMSLGIARSLDIIVAKFFLFLLVWSLHICIQIAMTGAYGIAYVKLFRKTYPEEKISRVHYLLQILPILDVISSHLLVSKHKQIFS